MAAYDLDGKALERVGEVFQQDVQKWLEDEDEAKHDHAAARQSKTALQRFYSDLWPKKVNLVEIIVQSGGWRDGVDPWTRHPLTTWRVATGSLVQGGGTVATRVTAGIAKVFGEHMQVLAGCRYKLPEAELQAVVDSLRKPVALDALHDILASAMANICQLINDLGRKEDAITSRLGDLKEGRLEMRRQRVCFRCTCKMYQLFMAA